MCATRVPQQGKVIRAGVLQGGKIIIEKRLDPGEPLTIGASPRASVSCPLPGLPRRYTLIEPHGDGFRLRVPQGLEGKLSLGGEVLSLSQLRQRPPSARGRWDLVLDDKSRGSIKLGELTLLFQLVQAPPVALRELQRPSFRPRLISDDDPVFLGFLSLFTVMASGFVAYTSTVQTPVLLDDPREVVRIAQAYLPAPDPEDEEPVELEVAQNDGPGREIRDEPEPEPVEQTVAKNDPPPERPLTADEAAYREIARKDALREQVFAESRVIQLLASRGNSELGFIDPSKVYEGVQTDADYDVNGGRTASTSFDTNWKDPVGTGGREDARIELGTATGGNTTITGTQVHVHPGRVVAETPTMPVGGADATKVSDRVKSYYPRVKTCYERRLKEIPDLRGRLVIAWTVSGGKALEVFVEENTTNDQGLEDCVTDSMRFWEFPPEIADFPVSFPFVLAPG